MLWMVTCVFTLIVCRYTSVLSDVTVNVSNTPSSIITGQSSKNVTMSPMDSLQSAKKERNLSTTAISPSSKSRLTTSKLLSALSKLFSSTSSSKSFSSTSKSSLPTSFSSTTKSFSLHSTSSLSTSNQSLLSTVKHKVFNDVAVTKSYDVLSLLPKPSEPRSTANLTILPVLALLAFLVMLCLKGCTWFRESTKDRDRDSIDADHSFMILHEGDKDYNDIDFRSDLSTPYDTYSSYMSFLRRNNNYDTVNSIRSLQGSRNYDTVNSYRSILQQRLENPNNDSVTSYQAFLQRVKAMKDVEVQVELLEENPYDRNGTFRHSRRQQRNENVSPNLRSKLFSYSGAPPVLDSLMETSCSSGSAAIEKCDVGVGNGVISHEESKDHSPKHHYQKSPTRNNRSNSPVKHRCHSSPVRRTGAPSEKSNSVQSMLNTSHRTEVPTSDNTTWTKSTIPGITDASSDKTACSKEISASDYDKSSTPAKNTSPEKKFVPRFRVSFVTDDESDVKSQKNVSFPQDKDKLCPNSTNEEQSGSEVENETNVLMD